jgi:hypothetical protein
MRRVWWSESPPALSGTTSYNFLNFRRNGLHGGAAAGPMGEHGGLKAGRGS